jgi:hypothetical protein
MEKTTFPNIDIVKDVTERLHARLKITHDVQDSINIANLLKEYLLLAVQIRSIGIPC